MNVGQILETHLGWAAAQGWYDDGSEAYKRQEGRPRATSSTVATVEDASTECVLWALVRLRAVVVPALRSGPPEVGLEDLAERHAARHAEGVEDHVDDGAVLQERHVLLVDDARDDALVCVTARELVALGDLALLRDEDANQIVDARRQVVAVVARDVMTSMTTPPRRGGPQRGVADLAGLLLEDRADQLLLGGQLGLTLGVTLPTSRSPSRPRRRCARCPVVEVAQRLLGAVRDVARDLLVAQLGRAGVDLVLLDVDRVSSSSLTRRLDRMIAVLEV